jgi:four helix bundle protein
MEKRPRVHTFEDLLVWQMGIELVKRVYVLTANAWFSKDFGLRNQIRRASVSIPTNIAEGFERASRKEYLNFLNIAKGSAGEVRSLLYVALEVGYLQGESYEELRAQVIKISAYLFNHRKAIKNASTQDRR